MGADPLTMGLAGGAVLGLAMGGMQKSPQMPAIQAPTAPPAPAQQAAQMPDTQSILRQNLGTGQAGGSPGPGQTFLTGAAGVTPDKLTLNKKTLLGS